MRWSMRYILIFIILVSSCVHARHPQTKLISGMSYQFNDQSLSIFIDQNKALKSMHALRKAGYLDDPLLTHTEASFYPLLPENISIRYAASIMKNIYIKNAKVDIIHVNAFLTSSDLYGNNEKSICYSFDFNRKLYQKINWKNFQVDNIKFIAPNFRTYGECQDLIKINQSVI